MIVDLEFQEEIGAFWEGEYWIALTPHGRAAGTTQSWARSIIVQCLTRISFNCLILRRYAASADDSILQTMRSICRELELEVKAPPSSKSITFPNGNEVEVGGTEIHIDTLRGKLEQADFTFIEECGGDALTEDKWAIMEPGLTRKPGARVALNWNPEYPSEWAWQMWEDNNLPHAYRKFLTYRDNAWLPELTRERIEHYHAAKNAKMIAVYEGDFPPTGSMFQTGAIRFTDAPEYWKDAPAVRIWDPSYSEGRGDYTVGLRLAREGADYLIADVKYGQWDSATVKRLILETAARERIPFGVERAGNDGWHDDLVREAAALGLTMIEVKPHGKSKPERAAQASAICNEGLLWVPIYADEPVPWWPWFRDCLTAFPSKNIPDDGIDALAYATMELAQAYQGEVGLFDYKEWL